MLLEGRLGAQKCSLSNDRLNTVTCQWERADGRGAGVEERESCVRVYMCGGGGGGCYCHGAGNKPASHVMEYL